MRCTTGSSSSTSRRGARRTTSSPSCARSTAQRRVGHAGTLDPDATGVLLVGLGRATRLLRFLQEAGKAYRGRVVFGIATSTLDAVGRRRRAAADAARRATEVEDAAARLRRRHRAAAADGVGGEGRRPPAPRAGARGRGGRARAASASTSTASSVEDFEPGPVPGGDRARRVRERHLRPLARRRPRRGARRVRAPRRAAPRCASARSPLAEAHAARRRSRPIPTPRCSPWPTPMRDLERVDVDDEQARAVRHGVAFPAGALAAHAATGPFALVGARRRRCSPSTSGAAPRCKPAVVLAAVDGRR